MSKIAFISDIHGNYPALSAVLKDIDNRGIHNIVCLGDIVGYYSMINEVIETIRERNIVTIMGNHDFAMVFNKGTINRSKTCTNVLLKQLLYIKQTNFNFLLGLKDYYRTEVNNNSFYCVHGGLIDRIDEYLFNPDSVYFIEHNFQENYLVTGHTHQFVKNIIGNTIHLNPGSVGQPRDNDNRASYLIIDNLVVHQVRVPYDIDQIVNHMKSMGFDEYIYSGLYTGKKIL
jgi:putative phosphoesterase